MSGEVNAFDVNCDRNKKNVQEADYRPVDFYDCSYFDA